MKKTILKRSALLTVLVLTVLSLTACVSAPPIEGTWTLTAISGTGSTSSELANLLNSLKSLGVEVDMTFKGGNVTLSAAGYDPEHFTYTLNGSKLTLTIDLISTVCTWAVSGNTLTIDYGGSHLVFTKKA